MKQKICIIASVLLLTFGFFSDVRSQWVQTNRLYTAGRIHCLLTFGEILFAGTEDGGVFSSKDYGLNWVHDTSGMKPPVAIFSLTEWESNLFAGSTLGNVFRSTDSGSTWNSSKAGILVNSIVVKKLNKKDGINLLAGTNVGLFISSDTGKTWVHDDLFNETVFDLAILDTNVFAATPGGGIFISTNSGINWKSVDSGLTDPTVNHLAVMGTNLFAGCDGGIFRSTNFGNSWIEVDSGLPRGNTYALITVDTNLFLADGNIFFLTTDKGKSWKNYSQGLSKNGAYSIGATKTDLFVGTIEDGIWRRSLLDFKGVFWDRATQLMQNDSLKSIYDSVRVYLINSTSSEFVSSVFFSGSDSSDFQIIHHKSDSIPNFIGNPNDSIWFDVRFKPDTTRPYPLKYADRHADLVATISGESNKIIHFTGSWARNSVRSKEQSLAISLSPNPTTGIITVHNTSANILHVSVSSILGESVLELEHPNAPDFTLDLSKLPVGIYFARFSSERGVITKKVIKN